mgnify:CR=1 FL=1
MPPSLPSIDEILCALLFLLSRQARSPGIDLAPVIREHLLLLANRPEAGRLAQVRRTSWQLATHWQGRGAEGSGPPDGPAPQAYRTIH